MARVDYLVVHRGRFRGHDHCVPASTIREAHAEGVTLTLRTGDLQALSAIESTMPGQSYSQRCIPAHCLVLDTATQIKDTADGDVGHLQGVAIDPERQVLRILRSKAMTDAIPASAVTDWKEGTVRVRLTEREAAA